jgi:hypothetical protein
MVIATAAIRAILRIEATILPPSHADSRANLQ